MKVALFAALAVAAASPAFAADVNVMGARSTTADLPMAMAPSTDASVNVMGAQMPRMDAANTAVRIASKDLLNRPTGLLNKNTLAMDNNVFIARSNIVFTQNDRLAMRKKVEDAVMKHGEQAMATATLTKDVMRAVSAPDTDTALMTKASAVVAAKGDATALAQRIADFVDAAGQREMDHEQTIQSQTPRGVIVMVGTKDLLRQPTGVVNKNMAASDNQISIARSNVAPTANDQVVLTGGAKVADAVLPAANVQVGQLTATKEADEPLARTRIAYPLEGEGDAHDKDHELWGLGMCGGGCGLGWRYPLGYWNTFGAGLYGGGCGLGMAYGGFFYC